MPLMNKHTSQQARQFSRALEERANQAEQEKKKAYITAKHASFVNGLYAFSPLSEHLRYLRVGQATTPHGSKVDVCKDKKMLEHSPLVLSISDRPHTVSKESDLFGGRRARLALGTCYEPPRDSTRSLPFAHTRRKERP